MTYIPDFETLECLIFVSPALDSSADLTIRVWTVEQSRPAAHIL